MADLLKKGQALKELNKLQDTIYKTHHFIYRVFAKLDNPVDWQHFGSTWVFNHHFGGFLEGVSYEDALKLHLSDFDMAVETNEFLLEELFTKIPSIQEKVPSVGDGPYERKEGHLRVFEMKLKDLLESEVGKEVLNPPPPPKPKSDLEAFLAESGGFVQKDYSCLKDLDLDIDLCFVESLRVHRRVWSNLPPKIFSKYYWKHSPSYIGKDNVKLIFDGLEETAMDSFNFGRMKPTVTIEEAVAGNWAEAAFAPDVGEPVALEF